MKTMKHKTIFYALLLLLVGSACTKNDIMTFDREESGVYFQYGGQTRFFLNIDAYYDSIGFSFSITREDLEDTILETRIRTMGKVRDYDRPVKVVVDTEHSTAIEGTHFELDYSKAVIPAGKSEIMLPVRFFRTPDLLEKKVLLVLRLEDNEYFKVYFDEQKNTNIYNQVGEQISSRCFVFEISEFYSEPWAWSLLGDCPFGEWTITKYRLINKLFNVTPDDWQNANRGDHDKVSTGYFPAWAFKLRAYLQEQADKGTPVLEEDGSYMQLGSGYEVDYSAYIKP